MSELVSPEGQPVHVEVYTDKNQDLWRTLHELSEAHHVAWHWLEGHAQDPKGWTSLSGRVLQSARFAKLRRSQLDRRPSLRLGGQQRHPSPTSPCQYDVQGHDRPDIMGQGKDGGAEC